MNAERGAARQRGASPIRPAIELSDRQRAVLRAVVEDYVLTAVPVGSKALLGRYALARSRVSRRPEIPTIR